MDVSTELVRAYLHVNGYFTATDYPLVESRRDHTPRTVTDIDMLAVRLGHPDVATRQHPQKLSTVSGPVTAHPDAALKSPNSHTDMIVAEIKQGRAQVNPAATDRRVLAAALTRFGCCSTSEAPGLVNTLIRNGSARTECDHTIRMVIFASHGDRAPRGWHWIHLEHVFRFLDHFLRYERNSLAHADLHDPALAWLSLMHKCQLSLDAAESSP